MLIGRHGMPYSLANENKGGFPAVGAITWRHKGALYFNQSGVSLELIWRHRISLFTSQSEEGCYLAVVRRCNVITQDGCPGENIEKDSMDSGTNDEHKVTNDEHKVCISFK